MGEKQFYQIGVKYFYTILPLEILCGIFLKILAHTCFRKCAYYLWENVISSMQGVGEVFKVDSIVKKLFDLYTTCIINYVQLADISTTLQ